MSTEPENTTTTPSTTTIWQGPAATPRIIEVKPDDWKRRMTSDEVAELHAKGWIIQQPITFVHPTTQDGTICYLCLPPRPEKVEADIKPMVLVSNGVQITPLLSALVFAAFLVGGVVETLLMRWLAI